MTVAIHLAHPAHYHLFKHTVEALRPEHHVVVTYNEKDVLGELLRRGPIGDAVEKIAATSQSGSFLGLVRQFVEKEIALFRTAREVRPDLILGTSVVVAHVGRLLGVPSVIVNEDDFDIVRATAAIGYPFASHILAPRCCRTSRWGHKVIAHDSYHELAYLGPHRFQPSPQRLAALGLGEDPFFLLRFADLSAHHDVGKSGIAGPTARELIRRLAPHGRVLITSERPLEPELEPYRIQIDPLDIHHALALAMLYVGDSQTMAAEAAVLGTPSLRFNDFVGRISYLEELEHDYALTFGIPTSEPQTLLDRVGELLAIEDLSAEWARRRERMLAEKQDMADVLTALVRGYPASAERGGAGLHAAAPMGIFAEPASLPAGTA